MNHTIAAMDLKVARTWEADSEMPRLSAML
jgi:hypothetical protein